MVRANGVRLAPYVGGYADYYFTPREDATGVTDTAGAVLAAQKGWAARVSTGIGVMLPGGGGLDFGAEIGGLGGNTRTPRTWSFSARFRSVF